MTVQRLWQTSVAKAASIGVAPGDDDETRLQKTALIVTAVMLCVTIPIWGLTYLSVDEPLAASIPIGYAILTIISLLWLRQTRRFDIFRLIQQLFFVSLPFFLMLALGGYINGSAVIVFAYLAPLGALVWWHLRAAVFWFIVFLTLVILSGFLQQYLHPEDPLPLNLIIIFFVLNIATLSVLAFAVLVYFVKQKEQRIQLMQEKRELERAYLQQEIMLRQSEKLATLGKLSAGMAHELNNPATAVKRGAEQLQISITQLETVQYKLGTINLSTAQYETTVQLNNQAQEQAKKPTDLTPLLRSDREYELETWLENHGIEDAWELAPMLVNVGYSPVELANMTKIFTATQLPIIVGALCSTFSAHNLLEEIGQGAFRISEIVKALKTYTYLDQAPIQSIDIHEGLDNTLVLLRSKLKAGVTVRREYAHDLPLIDAYGSELNQVWTNIIDNAIHAMDGQGEIVIRTYQEDPWLVVEICDSGSGIPAELQSTIFDPFITSKPPGEGTGLGLNISHNIIVQKHKGVLAFTSVPGKTCFEAKLPILRSEQ